MFSTVLDLAGIAALAAFAWFVWEPLPLAVVGVAALWTSWMRRPTTAGVR